MEIKSDVAKIKQFAKENGFEYGVNKNGTHTISIPVNYGYFDGYDQFQTACYIQKVSYSFTYTNWDEPISLRKTMYGYRACRSISKHQGNEFETNLMRDFIRKIKAGICTNKVVNIKQNLMKRYKTIEEALHHAKLNSIKELKKHKYVSN